MCLDTDVVGPQVPADLCEVLFVILWGNLHHSRVAGWGVVNPKETPHVVNQREGLEMLGGHVVDSRQEQLVKGLVVRCLAGLAGEFLKLLNLLAVHLLEVDDPRRCGFRRPPQLGDDGRCKGGGKLEVGAGVGECEVDGRLHFGR